MRVSDFVAKFDAQNQFSVLRDSYKQAENTWAAQFDAKSLKGIKPNVIILSGMGGSAICGNMLQNYLSGGLRYPFYVNRNYNIPAYIDEKSLAIFSSYSGATEETLSSLNQAIEKKCRIVCFGSGGKMKEIADNNNIPFFLIGSGLQPRYAFYSSFFALLKIFQELGLIESQEKKTLDIINLLKTKSEEHGKEDSRAATIAEGLIGYTPIIYSDFELFSAAAIRFKGQLNENSKVHSFCNFLPEMNHNEIVGWQTYDEKTLLAKAIYLIDKNFHPRVLKRFQIASELILQKNVEIINIESYKEEFYLRLFDIVYLCDWISCYLSVMRGKDPIEINNIYYLKNKLSG